MRLCQYVLDHQRVDIDHAVLNQVQREQADLVVFVTVAGHLTTPGKEHEIRGAVPLFDDVQAFMDGAKYASSPRYNGNHAIKWHLVTRLLGLPLLDGNDLPNDALRESFKIAKDAQKNPEMISMQFLDGAGQELNQVGWNIRFRKIQDKDHIELTYKRRYDVVTPGLVPDDAVREGFVAAANDFESEFEWGYNKQTLTFSTEKNAGKAAKDSLILPKTCDSQERATGDNMPDKFRDWKEVGWAESILAGACVYGPVSGTRWRGGHADIAGKIAIEVWAIQKTNGAPTTPIVEISFKEKEYNEHAKSAREKLKMLLEANGWLLKKEDILKTQLILEHYRRPGCR